MVRTARALATPPSVGVGAGPGQGWGKPVPPELRSTCGCCQGLGRCALLLRLRHRRQQSERLVQLAPRALCAGPGQCLDDTTVLLARLNLYPRAVGTC